MKHGPIALIDEFMPVVIIAPRSDPNYRKLVSNIEEVRRPTADGGRPPTSSRASTDASWPVALPSPPLCVAPDSHPRPHHSPALAPCARSRPMSRVPLHPSLPADPAPAGNLSPRYEHAVAL